AARRRRRRRVQSRHDERLPVRGRDARGAARRGAPVRARAHRAARRGLGGGGGVPARAVPPGGGAGLMAVGYPDQVGGSGGDLTRVLVASEELILAGRSVGTAAGLGSHGIALPPIVHCGNDEQKRRFVTPVLRGEKVAALA